MIGGIVASLFVHIVQYSKRGRDTRNCPLEIVGDVAIGPPRLNQLQSMLGHSMAGVNDIVAGADLFDLLRQSDLLESAFVPCPSGSIGQKSENTKGQETYHDECTDRTAG